MKKADNAVSSFNLSGKLSKIKLEKHKIKYIKLATEQNKVWIKIGKKLRKQISQLPLESKLEVAGKLKQYPKTGKVKYKAQTITVLPQNLEQSAKIKTKQVSLLPVFDSKTKSKAKVLICQKSNCWKKGGKQVFEELESVLSDRNLSEQIPIRKTGCLNKCKKAPNLVMLPDKAHYTKVKPKQVADFVEKHLISEA